MIEFNKNSQKIIFCEFCSFKKILKSPEDLKSFNIIKNAKIQSKLPDNKNKKLITKNHKDTVKCPKCGRGIIVKNLSGSHLETIKKIKEKEQKEKEENEFKKRIEDGKPINKKEFDYEN